jgi:hypothetical protein
MRPADASNRERVAVALSEDGATIDAIKPEGWKTQAEAESWKSKCAEFLDYAGKPVVIETRRNDDADKRARRKGRHQSHT